jgi:hypothetical protein
MIEGPEGGRSSGVVSALNGSLKGVSAVTYLPLDGRFWVWAFLADVLTRPSRGVCEFGPQDRGRPV